MPKRIALRKPLLVVAAFLLLAATTAALLRSSANETRSPIAAVKPTSQGVTPAAAPTLRVFVHPEDIYPNVVTIAPGTIQLRAENETLGDVSLVLERVTAGQPPQVMTQVTTVNKAKRAAQQVTLAAGEYLYYDQSRPDIKGKLIVAGKQ